MRDASATCAATGEKIWTAKNDGYVIDAVAAVVFTLDDRIEADAVVPVAVRT